MVLKGPSVLFCSSSDGKTLSTIHQFMNKSDFLTKPFFVLKIYFFYREDSFILVSDEEEEEEAPSLPLVLLYVLLLFLGSAVKNIQV